MGDDKDSKIVDFNTIKSKKEEKKQEEKITDIKEYKEHNKAFLYSLYAFIAIILLMFTIALPIFNIDEVVVTGNDIYTKETIEKIVGYDKNKNFFYMLFSSIEEKLNSENKIKKSSVQFKFPNKLFINIEESRIAGYIPYMDQYIYLDSEGIIVESSYTVSPKYPLIIGLKFDKFKVGEKLEVENEESLEVIIELTNMLNKHKLEEDLISLDVEDINDIHFFVGDIDVILGSMENCENKINGAMGIIKEIPNSRGYLDASTSSRKITFSPLT